MTHDRGATGGKPDTLPLEGVGSAVILLEDPADAGHACSLRDRGKAGVSIIPTTPATCWELEKRGVPFQPIEKFSDPAELSATGMDNFRKLDELCLRIDDAIREHGLVPEGAPSYPATDNFFILKILYDGLTIRARILQDLGRDLAPEIVFAFRHGRPDGPPPGPIPFHPDECVYALMLGIHGWPFKPVCIPIPQSPGVRHPPPGPLRRGMPSALEGAGLSFLSDMAFLIRQGRRGDALSLPLFSLRNRLLSAEHLMISGFAYSWNEIIPALGSEGYVISHWRPPAPPHGEDSPIMNRALDQVLDSVIPLYASLGEIDISDLLKERLIPILGEYLQFAPVQEREIRNELARVRPRAVLCGTKSSWRDHLLARVAKAGGIPVISWQHGAQGFFRAPMMRYVELRNSAVHLCFGEKVKDMIRREFQGEAPREVIPVGSYQLQELAAGAAPDVPDPDILYATTSYVQANLYVGGIGEDVFRDIDLWETQRSILDVLGRSGRRTVFKLHPGNSQSEHLREFLSDKAYQDITIVKNERSYTDLVRHAGAVVLDCPSTTLLEAVAAKRDVLVLLKHVRLTDDAMKLLRKRAYLAEDREAFTRLLAQYLRGEDTGQHPDPADTEFLEAYGVHILDGKVEERALSVIRGLPASKDQGKMP